MRYHSYLNSAKAIIESYRGAEPFAVFIRRYFSANKKYGGRDRKQIAALCYNFYRLGKAVPQLPVEEKIIVSVFLCEQAYSEFLQFHKPEWNAIVSQPVTEKIKLLGFANAAVFPWADELSDGIEFEAFCNSFYMQPDLFLRIRPGNKTSVLNKLNAYGIKYEMIGDDCIALPNSTKLDGMLEIDKEIIVQDASSQHVLDFIKTEKSLFDKPVTVWDCCAASGGKSMLAYDIFNGAINLTVSDVRASILSNLKKRFETAGIENYNSFIADLESTDMPALHGTQHPAHNPQLVICDAPCSGSGTWSRTPEQLYYFKQRAISEYAALQQRIVSNVIPYVQEGGIFIYITCSVFKKENEAVVEFIKEKFHLQLLQMELIKGFGKKADSMFTAVFKKL